MVRKCVQHGTRPSHCTLQFLLFQRQPDSPSLGPGADQGNGWDETWARAWLKEVVIRRIVDFMVLVLLGVVSEQLGCPPSYICRSGGNDKYPHCHWFMYRSNEGQSSVLSICMVGEPVRRIPEDTSNIPVARIRAPSFTWLDRASRLPDRAVVHRPS